MQIYHGGIHPPAAPRFTPHFIICIFSEVIDNELTISTLANAIILGL